MSENPAPQEAAEAGELASEQPQAQQESELEIVQRELAEAKDRYLRTLAETENFKKRMTRERDDERRYASQETVLAMLPLADNLDRALKAALAAPGSQEGAMGQLVKGVQLTLKLFEDSLRRLGVDVLVLEAGAEFDPHQHQALMQESREDLADNSVTEVLQRGYRMGDRVVRPALVKVNHKP